MSTTKVPTRRFGRTGLEMPVFTTGGMRYQQDWNDLKPGEITAESTEHVRNCILRSLSHGINHIETARGYGSSEYQLGQVFQDLPREQLIVQTKIGIKENLEQFQESFETSMDRLKLKQVDLLSIHGINNEAELARAVEYGVPQMREWRRQGRIRFIGFSTHGLTDIITKAAFTGLFDYMNVHWYLVNHDNFPAIQAAARQDMGVFIISPNDKGGHLHMPTEKLKEFCAPLTPMQFNALYCLCQEEVHTLSTGVAKPEDFDEHVAGMAYYDRRHEIVPPILKRIQEEIDRVFVPGWHRTYGAGLPLPSVGPGGLHLREILRLYTWAKTFDMTGFAKSRYNLFGNAGDWFAGAAPGQTAEQDVLDALQESPHRDRIPAYLQDANEMLKGEEVKRQSESEKEDDE